MLIDEMSVSGTHHCKKPARWPPLVSEAELACESTCMHGVSPIFTCYAYSDMSNYADIWLLPTCNHTRECSQCVI